MSDISDARCNHEVRAVRFFSCGATARVGSRTPVVEVSRPHTNRNTHTQLDTHTLGRALASE